MLNLKENTAANHAREIASYFNVKLDEGNDASTITMDNDQAVGFISSYRIFDGLSVLVYNIKFEADFRVDLAMSEDSPYYFSCNVKGNFLHRFAGQKEFVNVVEGQNMIVTGGAKTSVQIVFPANVKQKIAVIRVDVKLLGSQNIRNAKLIQSNIQELFQTIPQEGPYGHLGKMDVDTKKYASIVCENNEVDLVGGLLTEGAVFNMFASQLKSYTRSKEFPSSN